MSPTETRRRHLRAQISSHMIGDDGAIAAAVAAVKVDGSIDLLLVGIEPDHAAPLADSLDQLSDRLRIHAGRKRLSPRQDGGALISLLSAVAFASLAYINDVAWIDFALSITSQLISGWLANAKGKR